VPCGEVTGEGRVRNSKRSMFRVREVDPGTGRVEKGKETPLDNTAGICKPAQKPANGKKKCGMGAQTEGGTNSRASSLRVGLRIEPRWSRGQKNMY